VASLLRDAPRSATLLRASPKSSPHFQALPNSSKNESFSVMAGLDPAIHASGEEARARTLSIQIRRVARRLPRRTACAILSGDEDAL